MGIELKTLGEASRQRQILLLSIAYDYLNGKIIEEQYNVRYVKIWRAWFNVVRM